MKTKDLEIASRPEGGNTDKTVASPRPHSIRSASSLALFVCTIIFIPIFVGACAVGAGYGSGTVTLTSITPNTAPAGASGQAITVYGANFTGQSGITVNGGTRTTTFISGTQLSAALTSGDLSQATALRIGVTDPENGVSANSVVFSVSAGSLKVVTASLPAAVMQALYAAGISVQGGVSPFSWRLASGQLPPGLTLAPASGSIAGAPTQSGQFNFTVQVSDSESTPQTASQALAMNVTGTASPLAITTSSIPGGISQTSYSAALAATGGASPYTWSVVSGTIPAGLTLNASSGLIAGSPTTPGTSSFSVQVKDSSSTPQTANANYSLVLVGPLSVATVSLPGGQAKSNYSVTLSSSGGEAPYVWSLTSGSLPAGLTLNGSTGVISGTPTASGTSSFTVQVSDAPSIPQTASRILALTVAAQSQGTPLQVTSTSLAAGQTKLAYSATLAATGGTAPYTWSVASGSLPAGLVLNASSGAISGTPTAAGTSSFTVKATDSSSTPQQATQPLSISVTAAAAPPALSITTATLAAGQVQAAYSATLSATGGTAPYTWSIASGALPAGVTLNASTGAIGGTPTASGTSSFTIRVADSASQTAQQALSIAVTAAAATPLSISTTALSQGILSQTYSSSLQAAGGTPNYTWSIASGQLPAGLTLAGSGAISGTPTAAGQASFTVSVKDSASPANTATASLSITVGTNASLDQYGGRTDIKCSNATGWFHTEEINKRWWLCTPLGNAFFFQGVYGSAFGDANYNAKWQAKYPSAAVWEDATDNELLNWGFNSIGQESNGDVTPYGSQGSVMMPFLFMERPSYYSMENPVIQTSAGNKRLLSDAVKNMLYAQSSQYSGYTPDNGVGDYYDSKMDAWLKSDLASDAYVVGLLGSSKLNYLVGINSDDSDEMWGFGVGPEFALPGHTNVNLALAVASMSPVQTANSSYGWVYQDTVIHSKSAWHDYLVAEYGTINALNAAWGSTYTTFDSSGTTVTAESVGSGNGVATTFSHTFSKLTPSRYSVQVFVAGVPVAGDIGNGTVWGPNASGTMNYATGALAITFTSAPIPGSAITVNYEANGWEIGSGLMDEDNRASHQGWLGSDWTALSNANATAATDLNGFLFQIASQYFKVCHDDLKATFPNTLFIGPDTLTTFGVPSSAPVLRAAALYLDAFVAGAGQSQFAQPMIDFVYQNWGDKPYITTSFKTANADSALSAYAASGSYLTQGARGASYLSDMTSLFSATITATGSHPYIGMQWWDYLDNWGEKLNWGLKTDNDNAYDGHEAVQAAVTCSIPLQMYTCGAEAGNYGDVITSVRAANLLWLSVHP